MHQNFSYSLCEVAENVLGSAESLTGTPSFLGGLRITTSEFQLRHSFIVHPQIFAGSAQPQASKPLFAMGNVMVCAHWPAPAHCVCTLARTTMLQPALAACCGKWSIRGWAPLDPPLNGRKWQPLSTHADTSRAVVIIQ